VLASIEGSGAGSVRNAGFLESDGHAVLKYEFHLKTPPAGGSNTWMWNYWATRERGTRWVTLHLSVQEATVSESALMDVLGPGFRGDFTVE
jgi:hypothetical protein